jgi:hypothetical protein
MARVKAKFFVELPSKKGQKQKQKRRKPTSKEMVEADDLRLEIESRRHSLECAKQELARAEARCEHNVNFEKDMEGYVVRSCYICGHPKGIL